MTLGRLKKFSVANNDWRGTIPLFFDGFDEASFAGNDLCGEPLGKCGGLSKKNLAIIIAAGVFSATASLLLGLGLRCWYHLRVVRRRKRIYGIRRDNDSVRLRSLGLSYACPGFFVPKADREGQVG